MEQLHIDELLDMRQSIQEELQNHCIVISLLPDDMSDIKKVMTEAITESMIQDSQISFRLKELKEQGVECQIFEMTCH